MNKKIILLSLISCIFFISKIALSSSPQNVTKQQAANSSAGSIDQSSSSIAYSTASSEAAHAPLTHQTSASLSSSLLAAYTPSSTQPILYDSASRQSLASTSTRSRDLRAFTIYAQLADELSSNSHKSSAANALRSSAIAIVASASAQEPSSSSQATFKSSGLTTNTTNNTSSRSNNTDMLKKNKRSNLKCSFCFQKFKLRPDKDKHQWNKHRNETNHNCNECQLSYKHSSSLANHMKIMHATQAVVGKAQQSQQANPNSSSITASVSAQAAHSSSQLSPFDLTNTTANTSSSSNNTGILKKNKRSNLKCSFCSKEFKSIEERFKHQWDEHRNETNYSCEKCQLSYKNNYSLKSHMKMHTARAAAGNENIPSTPKKNIPQGLNCSFCSTIFENLSERFDHEWENHDNQKHNQCELCKKKYPNARSLKRHLQGKLHQDLERQYNELVQRAVSSEDDSSLSNHHTKNQRNFTTQSMPSQSDTYLCRQCNLIYRSRIALQTHKYTRHDESSSKEDHAALSISSSDATAVASTSASEEDYDETAQQESALKDGYAIKDALSLDSVLAKIKQHRKYRIQMQAAQTLALLSQSNANETVQLSSSSSSSAAAITTSAAAMPSSSSAITVDKVKGTKRKASNDGTAPDKKGVKKRKQK